MEKLCFLLVLLTPSWATDNSPVVRTVHGNIRGSLLTSRLNKTIYSFRGIRFAKPPVGNLRFQPPQPLEPWDGIVNATEDGASCPPTEGGTRFIISEDCLFLNVYTTKLPTARKNPKRDVIVFFHPGGWYSFTGNSQMFGPQYLLDKNVVLVTTNYRLGALGFLSTLDSVLPGNYGVKDQVATLRWVKANILAFGGNPDSVTITGYSAGGTSVLLHMVSPMSRGLFHKAIACSTGSAFAARRLQQDTITRAKKQAEMFGCPSGTSEEIRDCLMQIDALELVRSPAVLRRWGFEPILVYAPVIETDTIGEKFLVNDPATDFLSGNFAQVPFITGMNKDELAWKELQVFGNESWAEDLNENFDRVAPIIFMYESDTPRSREISTALRQLYFQDRPIDNSTAQQYGKMYNDGIIRLGEDRAAKITSTYSNSSVYYYFFTYQGRYSYIYKPGTQIPFGVDHHDDLIYIFYTSALFPFFQPSDPEIKTVERMTTLWANFARTGNPTPTRKELFQNVTWEPFTTQNQKYLEIGSDLQMNSRLDQETLRVWDRFFPLPQH